MNEQLDKRAFWDIYLMFYFYTFKTSSLSHELVQFKKKIFLHVFKLLLNLYDHCAT